MSNIVDKLMQINPSIFDEVEECEIEIKRLSAKLGEPFIVRCRALPGERFTELKGKMLDKKGNLRQDKVFEANVLAALEGIVSPDLKNEQLLKHYGCKLPKDLVLKLFNGGEIAKIADKVTELSGFGDDSDDEVKN